MEHYESQGLPCITLAQFNQPESVITTQFDYARRFRRGRNPNPQMSFRIIISTVKEKGAFSDFYYTKLNSGVNAFTLDQPFGLYTSKAKSVRFAAPLQINELGGGVLELTSVLELTDPSAASHSCVLVPSNTLNPASDLFPARCPTKP